MSTVLERERELFMQTYQRLPLDVLRGEGVYLVTKDGKKYLDFFSGLAVNALGHAHPLVIQAIQDQIRRYIHLSNTFYQDSQIELAEMLLRASGFDRVFLTNSGTEAMEGALKLARKWGKGKRTLYGFTNSFHGRTYGSLSITGREKYREGFHPFLPETAILPFNDVEQLTRSVNESTLAVVLEFIQGEGGIHAVSSEFVEALRDLRDRFGFLIIADEIQSGIGRTGKFFGFEHFNILPDIVVAAKALGGGLPLGAFLSRNPVAETFTIGSHGSTFGGNPVSCAAGIATLKEILEKGVMDNAESMGKYLKAQLLSLKQDHSTFIKDVRGVGLMLGFEINHDGAEFQRKLLDDEIIVNVTQGSVVRLLPPLIVEKQHIDSFSKSVNRTINELTVLDPGIA